MVRQVGTCGACGSCAGSLAIQVAEDVKIWRLPRCPPGVHHAAHLRGGVPVRPAVNHRPESRVREIRMHGSEGGGTGYSTGSSYPYLSVAPLGLSASAQASSWWVWQFTLHPLCGLSELGGE